MKLNLLLSLFILFNISAFSQNYSLVVKKGKAGLNSKEGKTIIPAKFDSITPFSLNKTQVFKAWKNNAYTIFNMDGKGDEKNPITDNFSITAFPSNEYVLTISGGEWYRLSLNKEKEITPEMKRNPNAGFKVWRNGKRGIYNYKTGSWLLQPVYSNIYVPVLLDCNRDSILEDKTIFNAANIYYAALNDICSWDIRDNRLATTPLIVKKDAKFLLSNWEGNILTEAIYDSIFYSQSAQVFYGVSSNKITAINFKGKAIDCQSNYSELLPNSEFVFVADSGKIITVRKSNLLEQFYIIETNEKNPAKKLEIHNGYDNTLELETNNMGIYNKRTGYLFVAKKHEGFWFYGEDDKRFYSLPDSIRIMDTTTLKPKKTETKEQVTKIVNPIVYEPNYESRNYGVTDGIYVKEESSKKQLNFGCNALPSKINLTYPFWGLKNKVYTLFDTDGKQNKEWNPKKFEYKYIALNTECYLLLNQNNTYSLINIYGNNVLPEKEYDKIIETKTGVITWKNNKKEVINF